MPAKKLDYDKPRLAYIPPKALWRVGEAFTAGGEKYGSFNYVAGSFEVTRLISAAFRHLLQFMAGEDLDKETRCHHVACAVSNLMILLEQLELGLAIDDRYSADNGKNILKNVLAVFKGDKDIYVESELDVNKIFNESKPVLISGPQSWALFIDGKPVLLLGYKNTPDANSLYSYYQKKMEDEIELTGIAGVLSQLEEVLNDLYYTTSEWKWEFLLYEIQHYLGGKKAEKDRSK